MKQFRLAREARQDIEEIWSYIVSDNRAAAARVRQEIRDTCRRLARHPYIGHKRDDLAYREGILFWPVYSSFLIVYRPNTKPLQILRGLHGMRNVGALLRRD